MVLKNDENIVNAALNGKTVKIWYYKFSSTGRRTSKRQVVEPYSFRGPFLFAWNIDENDHIRSYWLKNIWRTSLQSVDSLRRFPIEIGT